MSAISASPIAGMYLSQHHAFYPLKSEDFARSGRLTLLLIIQADLEDLPQQQQTDPQFGARGS